MEPPHTSNEETAKIDSDGDVLFIVGCDKPTTRLLVSSKVLSLASPVFTAMFSPRFKEGSNLNSDHPSRVSLPEDDPEAMTLLCNCLHFRTDHIPRNVEFSLLKSLAILCDKYNVGRAISPWSILWLQKWETSNCEDGFEGLLVVIYALDCAEAFAKISERAILNQVGSFNVHKVPDGFDMVPKSILEDFEVRRGAIQASVQKAIEDVATPIMGSNCSYKQEQAYAYLQGLHDCSLWPLSEKFRHSSLLAIREKIALFPTTTPRTAYCACKVCKTSFKSIISGIGLKYLYSITPLCLDCIKDDRSDIKENKKCRYPHSE